MKHPKTFLIITILIGGLFLANTLLAQEEATFSLSPSSGNYQAKEEFQVELKLNSPEAITSLKAYLNFDPSILSVTKIDTENSDFPNWWESAFDNETGKIKLQASTPSPGKTEGFIAKINLKAKKSGTATLTYDTSSLALKPNDENILNLDQSTGANFSIAPAPSPGLTTILAIVLGVLIVLIILFVILKKRLIPIK